MTNKEIEIQVWIGQGTGILTNCYALDSDHPMHPYNQVLAQGVRPEDYGMMHPHTEEFLGKTRDELICEIVNLRREITEIYKAEASGMISFGRKF